MEQPRKKNLHGTPGCGRPSTKPVRMLVPPRIFTERCIGKDIFSAVTLTCRYATIQARDGGRAVRLYRLEKNTILPAIDDRLRGNHLLYGPRLYEVETPAPAVYAETVSPQGWLCGKRYPPNFPRGILRGISDAPLVSVLLLSVGHPAKETAALHQSPGIRAHLERHRENSCRTRLCSRTPVPLFAGNRGLPQELVPADGCPLPRSGRKSLSRCGEKMPRRNWQTSVQCLPVRLRNSAKRTRLQREQSSVFNAHANPTVLTGKTGCRCIPAAPPQAGTGARMMSVCTQCAERFLCNSVNSFLAGLLVSLYRTQNAAT